MKTAFEVTNEALERVEYNNKEYSARILEFAENWVKKHGMEPSKLYYTTQ